jgi:hypothetical protein
MARAKKRSEPGWDEYPAVKLTSEQKAAARKELEDQSAEAARNGVWEQFLALEGKVRLELDVDELRRDRD